MTRHTGSCHRMTWRSRLRDDSGSALAVVLVLIVLLTVVGAAMVNSTLTEISIAYNQGDAAGAQYAAEAGLSRAMYELSQNAGWTGTTATIGDAQYVVTVASSGSVRSITSTGTRGGGRRVLKAAVKAVPQSATSTVLANTTATVGSTTSGLTVRNDFSSSGASAVHTNNKLAAPTAMAVELTGANVIGGLTANGTISGVTCATWAWTCNASAAVRPIPELDVDSLAATSFRERAKVQNLYFKAGDSRCSSFTSTQRCWDSYVNDNWGTIGSGISNPVFFIEFTAGEPTTYTTSGGGGGSIQVNLPIVIRDRYYGKNNGSSASGLTINRPTGVVNGDMLIAAISVRGAVPATPSGWTFVRSVCATSGSSSCSGTPTVSLALYWRAAGASEPSSYNWSSGSSRAAGVITAYYNVNTSNPIDVDTNPGQAYTSTTSSLSTPSITTDVANTMVVASFANAAGGSFGQSDLTGLPAGMTEEWEVNSGVNSGSTGNAAHVGMFDATQDAIGATGQKTVTISTAAVGVAHLLALRPQTATVSTSSGGSAPSFRAAASSNAGPPLTISKPTGVVDGDVMIANIGAYQNSAVIGAPAGWTLIRRTKSDPAIDIPPGQREQAVFYKVAAGEGTSYTFTATGAFSMGGGIAAYSGVDTTSPIDVENVEWVYSVVNWANTSFPAPSVVTTVANALLVASFIGQTSGSPAPPLNTPPGTTGRYSTSGFNAEGSDFVQATPGLTAALRATAGTNSRGQAFGHLLALKPAAGGTTVKCQDQNYVETLCIRAKPASASLYPNSVLTQLTGAIVVFRRDSPPTKVVGDIVFENMALAGVNKNYAHTSLGGDPALLAAGEIWMTTSGASAGRTSTSITGIIYTFAGLDNPDASSNLQGTSNEGFKLQHGAETIALTISGILISNGSISLEDTVFNTGSVTLRHDSTVINNLPAAFTPSTVSSILIPISWSSGD